MSTFLRPALSRPHRWCSWCRSAVPGRPTLERNLRTWPQPARWHETWDIRKLSKQAKLSQNSQSFLKTDKAFSKQTKLSKHLPVWLNIVVQSLVSLPLLTGIIVNIAIVIYRLESWTCWMRSWGDVKTTYWRSLMCDLQHFSDQASLCWSADQGWAAPRHIFAWS